MFNFIIKVGVFVPKRGYINPHYYFKNKKITSCKDFHEAYQYGLNEIQSLIDSNTKGEYRLHIQCNSLFIRFFQDFKI